MENIEVVDISDMIESESYSYTTSLVDNKSDGYQSGSVIQISLPPGSYCSDMNDLYIIFDSVVEGTNGVSTALFPANPSDFFNVSSLETNNVQLIQSNLSQGKNLYYNWLNALTPYKPETQMLPLTGLMAVGTTNAICNYAQPAAQILSYEPYHLLYQANQSHQLAYSVSQLQAAYYRQKQYNISLGVAGGGGQGVVTSTAPAGIPNEFCANIVKLADISTELQSLGLVNFTNSKVSIQLRLNDISRVLTSGIGPGALADDANSRASLILNADVKYTISNVCIYFKTMYIKQNLLAQAKLLMNRNRTIMCCYQQIQPLNGSITNQRISVNCGSNIYYVIVFLQPGLSSKTSAFSVGAPPQINYYANNLTNNDAANFLQNFNCLRYHTYSHSLEFKANLIVDIAGKQFKSTLIPTGSRELKSFLDATNSTYQSTGQHLNMSLNSFCNNKYFHIIPISPNQFPSTIAQDGNVLINVTLELSSQDRRSAIPTAMSMNTFVLGSKSLLNNMTRIE